MQTLYQAVNCMWLASFDEEAAEILASGAALTSLIDIIRSVHKEKGAAAGSGPPADAASC